MVRVSVTDLRRNFGHWLDRVEAGEEIVILRRGKEVARIAPPRREPKTFPDLTEFRPSIQLRGEGPLEALLNLREECRY
jgi:prevent-host-death family protein